MGGFARDVVELLGKLDSQQAILVGHSMGGTVALEAAAMAPERVMGVVLADTFLINYGAMDEATINGFYEPFAEDFAAAVGDLVNNTTGPKASEALKARIAQGMAAADPSWALPAWAALLRWDPSESFANYAGPIHAINCPLIPGATRERLAPYMSETIIPDTGHFLNQEAPDAFNQALDKAITRIAERHPNG